MDLADAIHNPLAVNLARQTNILLEELGTLYTPAIQECTNPTQLLNLLSQLLSEPAKTSIIARLFRPLLLDLCARWLQATGTLENELVALCSLVEVHEELFPILYRLLQRPQYEGGPLQWISSEVQPASISIQRLHKLLLAYFRILQINRQLPEQLSWSLAPLHTIIWAVDLDNGSRMLAIQCYALQLGMGEAARMELETQIFGPPCEKDCWIEYGQELDGTSKKTDGWVLPLVEATRIRSGRDSIAANQEDFYYADEGQPNQPLSPSELSPYIVDIHGILLVRDPPSTLQGPVTFVETQTAIRALRSLAIHMSLRVPVLFTSPPSCGKSLLITHLAKLLHPNSSNHIITIHLADTSLDPRSLLGSYISSPTQPGAFEWKDGTLVRAMKQGKWLVLEDIDRGSSEVLGIIKPLAKSMRLTKWIGGRATIDVPGHGIVVAAHGFALFATRSTAPSKDSQFPGATFFGSHKFHEVILQSPTLDELQLIIDTQFPRIAGGLAHSLILLWRGIVDLGTSASVRDVGLRELQKFCQRVSDLLPPSFSPPPVASPLITVESIFPNSAIREEIYVEARDVFFGAGSITSAAQAHHDTVSSAIGQHLGLDADRQAWALSVAPSFNIEKDVNGFVVAVQAGRSRLVAQTLKRQATLPSTRPFALHKPAICLLSRIATAVSLNEPILLTGETGTGKTSVVSYLASLLRRPLISLNLSHQTESADLLGGFKPIDARLPATSLHAQFLELFGLTFSRKKNAKFEDSVRKAVIEENWRRCVALWKEAVRLARERIAAKLQEDVQENSDAPRKRRKLDEENLLSSEGRWTAFGDAVSQFEVQHVSGQGRFAFGFVEGPLVKAIRNGDWVLLDEVNLASPETLECISGLLHGPTASITLTEQGSLEPVPRHPDFRLFACMNPATDVGKKDLPPNIRARFTEFDVPSPDSDRETLLTIVNQYLGHAAVGDKGAILNIAEFYVAVKQLAQSGQIADGSNYKPHFSMRTLTRALTFASDITSLYGLRRAIWEGCLMAFTMVLDAPSAELVTGLAQKHLLAGVRNPRAMLAQEISDPSITRSDRYVKLGPFYLEKGPFPDDPMDEYIMTPSVEAKLIDLARIILTRRFPVLIEGPTSSGKTSSVEYLARRTGHRFVRINNHEHTDIQEYVGSYVSDPETGKFVFKDGLLVQALREGHWIVLDELNLAPTDVLEALNRLLDDNRELVIPETHEVVKPHPHFMLFAAQNPPGLYAGRKVLSRAFRNRFLEVHYEDVPQSELETILCQRCQIAPSYGKKIVAVFRELQKRRQSGRVFDSKEGFATLRDLFRWAGRDAVGYQELAENGYMLLAERARKGDDQVVVKDVIESIMGVKLDPQSMYRLDRLDRDLAAYLGCSLPNSSQLAWTTAMQRLFILVARALRFNEPILLVGETGTGKTSICQLYADAVSQQLHMLNCHQNTETADLLGGLRPVRNRGMNEANIILELLATLSTFNISVADPSKDGLRMAIEGLLASPGALDPSCVPVLQDASKRLDSLGQMFEWKDGPLVQAMRQGSVFLLDEISLADDSVLERLNSVLEPARTLVLAERGGDRSDIPFVLAAESFKLVATMNPGGDFGKKELSPALRNRFTEIWVPSVTARSDLELIVDTRWQFDVLKPYTNKLLDFVEWLCREVTDPSLASLRDILAWVDFSNALVRRSEENHMSLSEIFHHGAQMAYLDGLGSFPQLMSYSQGALTKLRARALSRVHELVPLLASTIPLNIPEGMVRIGQFDLPKGAFSTPLQSFNLETPTTQVNVMRVARACQLPKPVLLEGSPGVGKTTLVTALAALSSHRLCRINLSDQTDLIDLFGSDLPVDGGKPGEFMWKDAAFLRAMQEGHWVLLDEMNLAPQAVLEGLNAVLDHRGTVYIPELGRSFQCHPRFRIFAAQNPLGQGGGRKGLPRSFVNRFTRVYFDEHTPDDLLMVCQSSYPTLAHDVLRNMISYNSELTAEASSHTSFARNGAPWEFNLRDILRWCALLESAPRSPEPSVYLWTAYLHRFRDPNDCQRALGIFQQIFSEPEETMSNAPHLCVTPTHFQIGYTTQTRHNFRSNIRSGRFLPCQLSVLETLGHCVKQNWLAILTGPKGCGKAESVRLLADVHGSPLLELAFNSATDTTDILGSFEQVDSQFQASKLLQGLKETLKSRLRGRNDATEQLVLCCESIRNLHATLTSTTVVSTIHATLASLQKLSLDGSLGPYFFALRDLLDKESQSSAGRFAWMDGPLVRAAKDGHWLLINGANLCNPSVLDRLNSLCEPDGELILSERGLVNGTVEVVKPHPNFRLFMSVDPHFGELSRAMRNRGVEIAFPSSSQERDLHVLQDFTRLPIFTPNDGINDQSVSFDLLRRGIHLLRPPQKPLSFPLGGSLDYAPLFNLANPLAVEIDASSSDAVDFDNILFFHTRVHTIAHMPYITRFIDALDQRPPLSVLKALTYTLIWPRLKAYVMDMAQIYCDTMGVLPGMGVYQRIETLLDLSLTEHHSANPLRTLIFHALDICTLLFLHDIAETPKLPLTNSRGSTIYLDIENVVSSVLEHCRAFMKDVTINFSTDTLIDIQTVSRLLRYALLLRSLVRQPYLDHTAAQTIAQMMAAVFALDTSESHPFFQEIVRLNKILSPSSGLGLMDVWSTLYRPLPTSAIPERMTSLIARLGPKYSGESAERPREDPQFTKFAALRRTVFDLMAIHDIHGLAQDELIANVMAKVDNRLVNNASASALDIQAVTPAVIAELDLHASWPCDQSPNVLRMIKKLVILNFSQDLRHYLPHQHLLWAIGAEKPVLPLLAKLRVEWHQSLWELTPPDTLPQGPTLLLAPVNLVSAFSICRWESVPLGDVEAHDARLGTLAQLALLQCDRRPTRLQSLRHALYVTIFMICGCFSGSYELSTWQELRSNAVQPSCDLEHCLSLLKQTTSSLLKQALETFLQPHISELATSPDAIDALGLCWMAVGQMLLHLIVPDVAIDPAVKQNFAKQMNLEEMANLRQQILLHAELEKTASGNMSNASIRFLTSQCELMSPSPSDSAEYPQRSDPTTIATLWKEVEQFQRQVLPSTKLDPLAEGMRAQALGAVETEALVQQSIAGFVQRLKSTYEDYPDLLLLLELALSNIRFGLRLIAQPSISRPSNPDTSTLASALVSFPSTRSSSLLLAAKGTTGGSNLAGFRHILLNMAAVAHQKSHNVPLRDLIDSLQDICSQANRMWLIDCAREADTDRASQSLYRSKTEVHADGSAQAEEEDFLALFPSFENALDTPSASPSSKGPQGLVDPHYVNEFVHIYQSLFSLLPHPSSFEDLRKTTLDAVLRSASASLSANLDLDSRVLQLNLVNDHKIALAATRSTKAYNFYSDPNIPETSKSTAIILNLISQLKQLSDQWPEQVVLRDLLQRCQAFLDLELHCSVAKALAALEQILFQTQDWEAYASRETSLKLHQQALTSLIVHWRRLELSAWQALLDAEFAASTSGVSPWWFRLYNVLVHGVLDLTPDTVDEIDTGIAKYLGDLIPLLENFIRSAPLGQYQSRLTLLESFRLLTSLLASSESGVRQVIFRQVHRILHHLIHSFNLYTSQLSLILGTERTKLEKSITDLIKLASWKDVNVHALRESARRSHYQLFKLVRKYREVLRQPVNDKLVAQLASPSNINDCGPSPLKAASVTELPPFPAAKGPTTPHLLNIGRTFAKFKGILSSHLYDWHTQHSADVVNDLAVEVITTSADLASIPIPSHNREKQSKALLVRKRKAWSDLLKELKRAGLSFTVQADVLRRQADPLWIYDQTILASEELPFRDCEKYFLRTAASLSELRKALAHHHSDLTTRELQRGQMLVESAFSMATGARAELANHVTALTRLESFQHRLFMLQSHPAVVTYGTPLSQVLIDLRVILSYTQSSLTEMIGALEIAQTLDSDSAIYSSIIQLSRQYVVGAQDHQRNVSQILDSVNLTQPPILLQDEAEIFSAALQHLDDVMASLSQWCDVQPSVHHIIDAALQWLSSQIRPVIPPKPLSSGDHDTADPIINSFLVVAQDLLANFPSEQIEVDRDRYIRDDLSTVQRLGRCLDIDGTNNRLAATLSAIAGHSPETLGYELARFLPFLDAYVAQVQVQVNAHARWLRSVLKLDYVVCSVVHTLTTKGFCKPAEDDTEGGAEGGAGQVEEGVGLGEGTGSENVSKEIEEEHQVEGLQGEDGENEGGNDDDDSNAIEMDEDIGGDMKDVDPGSENEDDSEDEPKDEPDEQLGQLDKTDPAAVDEKLWGDEEGPTPEQDDEKSNQDRSQKPSGESEVVAKEGQSSKEKSKEQEKQQSADDNAPEDELEEQSAEDPSLDEPGPDGAPMDDFVQNADTLDLPDDINFDQDQADTDDMDVDLDDDGLSEGPEDNTLPDLPNDEGMPEEPIDDSVDPNGGGDGTPDESPPQADPDSGETENTDEQADNPAIGSADITSGDGSAEEQSHAVDKGESSSASETAAGKGGFNGGDDQNESASTEQASDAREMKDIQPDSESAGDASSGTQQGPAPSQDRRDVDGDIPNPHRSLSDALQEIQRRLGPILEGPETASPKPQSSAPSDVKQVEYQRPGDEDHNMDALGPSGQEEAAQLDKLKLVDEEDGGSDGDRMEVDSEQPTQHPKHLDQAAQRLDFDIEKTSTQHDGMEVDSAIVSNGRSRSGDFDAQGKADHVKSQDSEENSLVEMQLREWQTSGRPEQEAERIWRLYESLTSDLSHALCEQLRLILEPTLATRLKGDYRTGKRLNMKRVISYIASDFTKDKIWLRRTRPSQREYQILLALDDSRSMAESHSVHLAFQTLALVSKALTRLEAGDIGVAKFGKDVNLLHGFDDGPFNDLTGTRVINSFQFDQKSTNVLSLVQQSLRILEHARERRSIGSSTSSDLWQLEIIVSDGICQDHEELRTVLRKAAEHRVMIVFIIIDSLHAPNQSETSTTGQVQNSILSMEKAAFKTVDGRMELQLERYLDSFPFDYYVVLRSVESLPDVLAGTLKQFFERISGQ